MTAPVSPVRRFVCTKLRDVQLISLPGALVIGQISPFNQVVVVALLIHTVHTQTHFNLLTVQSISIYSII